MSILLFLNSAFSKGYAQEDIIFVISYSEKDYFIYKIANDIVNEISQKINMKITLVELPPKRAIDYLLKNKVHADIGRIEYYQNIAQDLIKIKESIIELNIHAYSMKEEIKVSDWGSLDKLSISYIEGRIFKKQFLDNHKNAHYVNSIYSGFKMIESNHVDVYLDYSELADPVLYNDERLQDSKILKLEPSLELMKFYVFFAPEYHELAKKFEKAFYEMKEDGTYKKIISRHSNIMKSLH